MLKIVYVSQKKIETSLVAIKREAGIFNAIKLYC